MGWYEGDVWVNVWGVEWGRVGCDGSCGQQVGVCPLPLTPDC